jgi:FKBP-type peptidyl-prolyl cis-trans isomerase (trigger factor)
VDWEVERDVQALKEHYKHLGFTWEKYLSLGQKTEESVRAELRPEAERRLRRILVLLEVMKAEKIEVTEAEITAEIERRAKAAEQESQAKSARRAKAAERKSDRVELARRAKAAERKSSPAEQVRRDYANREARKNLELDLKLIKTVERLEAMVKGEPTSGKILVPSMVKDRAERQSPIPTGLITDPSKVRPEDWPKGLK